MKKIKPLQMLGLGLILCGLLALLVCYAQGQLALKQNGKALSQIQSILPPVNPGVMDQYADMQMPSLEVEGYDYVALLEVPSYGVKLPVRSQWSRLGVANCPSRFYGTVYDGSLIIGGKHSQGQFGFLSQLQNGDQVLVTDMTGAQFAYRVAMIYRGDSADAETLMDAEYDLTLFARNSAGLEYIIVRCKVDAATK